MRIMQGTFSFLPDLTDEEIRKQVEYCLRNDWPINIEFIDDPRSRSVYWELWSLPIFDLRDPAAVMLEINACREAHPNHYVKVNGYNVEKGVRPSRYPSSSTAPSMSRAFGWCARRRVAAPSNT